MHPELVVSRLYHDADIVEIAVTVWNGLFGGTVDLYVAHDELEQVASDLRAFPTSTEDQREITIGTFDPKFAGGGTSMRFFCIDRALHAQLQLKLETGREDPIHRQRVELLANIEPAAIDDFIQQLIAVSRNTRSEARLRFADALNRP